MKEPLLRAMSAVMQIISPNKAALVLLLAFSTITGRAGDATAVTNKFVYERDDKGTVVRQTETWYRGSEQVLETRSHADSDGKMIVDTQIFAIDRKYSLVESKNAKGLETFTIFKATTNLDELVVDMFNRMPDGSTKPVEPGVLEDYKNSVKFFAAGLEVAASSSTNRIQSTIESPDKKYVAIVFEAGCGATCGFNRQVAILKKGEEFPGRGATTSFFSLTAEGIASSFLSQLVVRWNQPHQLSIKYPVGAFPNGPTAVRTNQPPSVRVRYEPFHVQENHN